MGSGILSVKNHMPPVFDRWFLTKQHYKYVTVVMEKFIKALGWKEGDELKAEEKKGKLVVEKQS